MAEWKVISIDHQEGTPVGLTSVMKVPGGMIVRTILNPGHTSMVFVPIDQLMVAPGKSNIDAWIEENTINT